MLNNSLEKQKNKLLFSGVCNHGEFSLIEIVEFYEHLVSRVISQINRKQFEDALHTISEAARIAYLINWRYQDERLENAMQLIGRSLLTVIKANNTSCNQRVVFFDSWGLDARGLSLQYIRALSSMGSSILFICESRSESSSIGIREALIECRADIIYLDKMNSQAEKAKKIHFEIAAFKPTKILMHMSPWASGAIAAFNAIENIPRYLINLTDHAFWLGTGCTDYSVEFRSYGANLSRDKRGISSGKILINPYYPIVEEQSSGDLPQREEGQTVILTGGSFYKMYGREGYFFDLIKLIIDQNPSVVIWIAGTGRSTMLKERLKNHIGSGRVKLIGNRQDINAVLKTSDIYLATYPLGGALMAQLAVANFIPILSYTSSDLVLNHLDEIVGTESTSVRTFTEICAFLEYASELINDPRKRNELAAIAKSKMHTRNEFERNTKFIFNNSESKMKWNHKSINIEYDSITKLYVEIENCFQDELARRILRNTSMISAVEYLKVTVKAFWHVVSFILKDGREKMWKVVTR